MAGRVGGNGGRLDLGVMAQPLDRTGRGPDNLPPSYQITMNTDHTVTAFFTPVP